jgi:hypothetical protein
LLRRLGMRPAFRASEGVPPPQRRDATADLPPARVRLPRPLRPRLHAAGVNRVTRCGSARVAALLLLAALGTAPTARAAALRWEGTLGLDLLSPVLPSLALTGTGVATLDTSAAGSHLTALRLAGGIQGEALAPVTDPEVTGADGVVALRLGASLGSASLAPFGPGPLTRSTLPVRGMLAVCLFDPACLPGGFLPLPLDAGSAGVGVGGSWSAGRVSLAGAPWTLGTALLGVTTSGGASLAVPATGWVHGALSFTSSTALVGGALSLVTPIRVDSDAGLPLAGFGRLTLRFVPEPDRLLGLLAGAAALAALRRVRRA